MMTRVLESEIVSRFFQGKAIVIVGARQVGKTTLLQQIMQKTTKVVAFWNCDEPETRDLLTNTNIAQLKLAIGENKIIVIDEAQRVDNIGLTLKLIVDNFKEVQLIATGSSAFDLRNKLNEPLTGRKFEYMLFPLSSAEIIQSEGLLEEKKKFESRLIYGSYPEIVCRANSAKELLMELAGSYLYKDIFALDEIRKPAILDKLLIALALQMGSEVSYNELAQTISSDSKTIEKYIDLLEKCFVLFRLNALNRNVRTELKKSKKIYFYDNGIRNALIQNFAPLNLRQDVGALWENFFIAERLKYNHYHHNFAKTYFWRTTQQQEIDFIEEVDGEFSLFEMKWNPNKKSRFPALFLNNYDVKQTAVITPDNYLEWVL